MKNYTKLILLSLIFIFTLSACNVPSGFKPDSELPFEDDFSFYSSGWDRMNETDFSTDYLEGYYVISIKSEEYMAWANPGKQFTDTHIEVEATYIGGELDNHFGVICRAKNIDNFYVMMISSDGFYAIAKRIDGEPLALISGNRLEFDEAILQGVATNKIEADCVGDRLSLSVNGKHLVEVEDSSLSAGDVGLLAGTFNVPETVIAFDNFKVTQP